MTPGPTFCSSMAKAATSSNLSFLSLMKQNDVEVICFPAPQPANTALFGSLKHNWCEASRKWNQQCAGMKLPKAHYCSVFMEAWKKSAIAERAKDVFRTTGMFPINKFTSIGHESTTLSAEDAAHCSTESGSEEVASFTDFVVIQKTSQGCKVTQRQDSTTFTKKLRVPSL